MFKAEDVQICVRWTGDEGENWAARIMPWEFLLVRAAHELGLTKSPVFFRFLDCGAKDAPPVPATALAVVNLPRETDPAFVKSAETECGLVKERLEEASPPLLFRRVPMATEDLLNRETQRVEQEPQGYLLHYIGQESVQPSPTDPTKESQQVWRPCPEEGGEWITLEKAGQWLGTDQRWPPTLVSLSFCSTGPRLAALAVAHGAHGAIGFQDLVANELCESFFCIFYTEYSSNGWDLADAFRKTITAISDKLRGTGVILWSRHSLLNPVPVTLAQPNALEHRPANPALAAATINPLPPAAVPLTIAPPQLVLSAQIRVEAVANAALNYSVLHNQHYMRELKNMEAGLGLLQTFKITSRASPTTPIPIETEVTLFVGDQQCSWRSRIELDQSSKDLRNEVCIPLTSNLTRSLRESLRSTMMVSVWHLGDLLYQRTFQVSLLAIDEWIDDRVCHIWLPSFVLPRDPEVLNLVRLARRCLRALLDDFTAAFDGYQSGDAELVDLQVQALWATIVQDWNLGYINPPPTFSARSQRLRPPTAIYAERAGTCIDLALLLAACMEHIGLEPLLMLCPGHALVGYCRTERPDGSPANPFRRLFIPEDSSRYQAANNSVPAGTASLNSDLFDDAKGCPWIFGKDFLGAIRDKLDTGAIMAVEATGLTRSLPFAEALRLGASHLSNPLEFDHLIDVYHARVPPNNVTPLPMVAER
ncbi:MAG: hypothetical protein NTV80_07430 [Verrucomicrobia bacterium]|nr:hypothetical protein [Verrucomicrobiota bacterium]